jgi:hypothetical protein
MEAHCLKAFVAIIGFHSYNPPNTGSTGQRLCRCWYASGKPEAYQLVGFSDCPCRCR